jgi:hypothetical protein
MHSKPAAKAKSNGQDSAQDSAQDVTPEPPAAEDANPNKRALKDLFTKAFEMSPSETGWVFLGELGNKLRMLDPAFDPRSYGHRQLSLLVEAHTDLLETQKITSPNGTSIVHVRLNKNTPPPTRKPRRRKKV